MTTPLRLRGFILSLLSGACLASVALSGSAPARANPAATSPVLTIGPNEAAVSRRVELSKGRSLIIDLPRDAKEVFVANPAVANLIDG